MPRVGCGLVFLKEGRILLLKRKSAPEAGAWGITGGKIDFLEHAEDAARREAREETGLEALSTELIGLSEQLLHDEDQHWLAPIFLTHTFSGHAVLMEPAKHADLGWYPLDALPEPITMATRHAIGYLSERGYA